MSSEQHEENEDITPNTIIISVFTDVPVGGKTQKQPQLKYLNGKVYFLKVIFIFPHSLITCIQDQD